MFVVTSFDHCNYLTFLITPWLSSNSSRNDLWFSLCDMIFSINGGKRHATTKIFLKVSSSIHNPKLSQSLNQLPHMDEMKRLRGGGGECFVLCISSTNKTNRHDIPEIML